MDPTRRLAHTVLAGAWLVVAPGSIALAEPALEVRVTTRGSAMTLPGATVTLRGVTGGPGCDAVTDENGGLRVPALAPGQYRLAVHLDGFRDAERMVEVRGGEPLAVAFDLELAGVTERIEVGASGGALRLAETLGGQESVNAEFVRRRPGGGGDVQAALQFVPGVLTAAGGVSIRGGRPSQAALQIGAATLSDPAVGGAPLRLPIDVVETVEVHASPYAVEYGRFSSGVTVIQPRAGGSDWRSAVTVGVPSLLTRRGEPWKVVGVESFSPRIAVEGPIVPGRLHLMHGTQLRYWSSELESRPQSERRTRLGLGSFTRLDLVVSPRNLVTGMLSVLPEDYRFATLDTFTPPEATVDLEQRVAHAAVTQTLHLQGAGLLQTTLSLGRRRTGTSANGEGEMEVLPEGPRGGFYAPLDRQSQAFQLVQSLSGRRSGPAGEHRLKVGLDVLHTRYDESGSYGTVHVRRADGSLAQQVAFEPGGAVEARSTDWAVFAQDSWSPHARVKVDLGARLDRDGVLGRFNATPRAGVTLGLTSDDRVVLRAGVGLFFERTPTALLAFESLPARVETRFDAGGLVLPVAAGRLVPRPGTDLETARSRNWSLGVAWQATPSLLLRAGLLARDGTHELVVDPVGAGTDREMRVESRGRSRYRDVEVGLRHLVRERHEVSLTYTLSSARGDLNAYATIFDAVRSPFVREGAWGPLDFDVPHRLVARTWWRPSPRWSFGAFLDARSGLPWSAVDEQVDFVGPRNERRFPVRCSLELSAERQVRVLKWRPWLGVAVYNALNRFTPFDVQRSLASPQFGQFFNSDHRQIRAGVRLGS